MIRLKDVEMEYDNGTRAIKGISLTIEDGEFVFLVGPSGSGKSTIIKLLTGEVEPCAGRIMINGFSVSNISERQIPLMRRTLGVIFQDFRLIEKKTVYDNLDFVMRAVGASPKEIRKRIPYVLDLVGLAEKANSYPTELSGGEQQRVAIARALVNNPNTIIADEPTGNLDPERSLELMSLLVKINQLGTTVVVVTHEKDLVNRFQERVVMLERGRIVGFRLLCFACDLFRLLSFLRIFRSRFPLHRRRCGVRRVFRCNFFAELFLYGRFRQEPVGDMVGNGRRSHLDEAVMRPRTRKVFRAVAIAAARVPPAHIRADLLAVLPLYNVEIFL